MFFINPFIYAAGADFESIATVTVGSGGASGVEFTNIPAMYQHLQIRGIAKDTRTTGGPYFVNLRFNTDAGTNYSRHSLSGDGATVTSDGAASGTFVTTPIRPIATSAGWGATVLDILDYAQTSKNKTVRSFDGYDANGSGTVRIVSGCWLSTSAVSSIQLATVNGTLAEFTTFALYGVRA